MINEQYIISFELLKDRITSFKEYPFNLSIVKCLDKIKLHRNVTFFVGENGTGKSTLLEALAVQYGFNPEGGSKNFNFFTQNTHSPLSDLIRISKGTKRPKDGYFLRAESFYNLITNIDKIQEEGGGILDFYGGKSLHKQSHGESFFSLFIHRFIGNGVYILDEPEAALSPQRQLAFLVRMDELIKKKSQFIIATHSPIILSYPHAKIIEISENGLEQLPYHETSHYNLYKSFLNSPENMIKKLNIK